MSLNDEIARTRTDPPVLLDAAHVERLQGMAMASMGRVPEVAERLLQEIERSRVVPAADLPQDVVTIGSRVTFVDESTGRQQTVTVVFPPDADIAERRVSVLTPIGAALIGIAPGASISWETRTGETRELTVIDVSPPEQVGHSGTAVEAGALRPASIATARCGRTMPACVGGYASWRRSAGASVTVVCTSC